MTEDYDADAERIIARYRDAVGATGRIRMKTGALAAVSPMGQAMLRACARHEIEVELA